MLLGRENRMKEMVRSVVAIVGMDLKKLFKSPKLYLVIFFSFYFLQEYSQSYIEVIKSSGLAVTPFFYPIFYGDWSNRLYILMLFVVLFSDAPYKGKETKFTVLRSGEGNWAISRVVYTIVLAVIYQLILYILSLLVFFPNVGFRNEWGFVIESVTGGFSADMTVKGDVMGLGDIVERYSPVSACEYNMGIAILVSVVIGLVILVLNGFFRNGTGTLIVIVLATADHFISMMNSAGVLNIAFLKENKYVHIMSWMDMSSLCVTQETGKMLISNLAGILLVVSVILSLVFYVLVKKRIIPVGE